MIGLDHYSPTTLSMKCPRRLIKYINKKQKEGFPDELPEVGFELHKLIEEALTKGDFTKLKDRFPHDCTTLKRLYEQNPKTESWLKRTIDLDGEKKELIGRADIIINKGDKAILIDAKSSYNPKVASYHKRQLAIYVYMLLQKYKEVETQIYWIRYDFLSKSRNKNSGLKTYGVFDTTNIEEEIKKNIRRIDNILTSKNKTPKPNSSDCMFCDWSLSCPSIDVKEDLTLEELVNRAVQVRKKSKEYERILKTRLQKEKGQVDISEDKFIGFYSYDSLKIDPMEFLALANEVDLPMEEMKDLLKVKIRKFKKFVKDAPAFGNLPEAITKVRWSGLKGKKK